MSDYREKIYASYNNNFYGWTNTGTFDGYRESYRAEFSKFLPEDKKANIIDLGCGCGFLVYFLIKEGYENVLGLDTSNEQVELAKSHNLPVMEANALDYIEENKNFDLIFLTDVVEHLRKDEIVTLLEKLREALAPNGYVIIKVPNADSFVAAHSRYIDMTHEISFTEISLRQVLLACNFTQILITDHKAPFGWKPGFSCKYGERF